MSQRFAAALGREKQPGFVPSQHTRPSSLAAVQTVGTPQCDPRSAPALTSCQKDCWQPA